MKKLLCALLSLTTALALAACGGDSGSPENTVPNEKDTVTLHVLTEEITYNEAGEILRKITYTYDDRGLMLSRSYDDTEYEERFNDDIGVFEYLPRPCDGVTDLEYTYAYDDHGNMTSIQLSELEDGVLTPSKAYGYTYTYNEDGSVASYVATYDTITSEPIALEYDDQGRLLAQGDLTCAYDDEGRLLTVYHPTQEVDETYHFTYDDQGHLLSVVSKYPSGEVFRYESAFTYDADGHILTEDSYYRGSFTYTYADGILTTIEGKDLVYSYDKNGLLIKRDDTEYHYESIEVTPADAVLSERYWDIRHDPARWAHYYKDITPWLLPGPFEF